VKGGIQVRTHLVSCSLFHWLSSLFRRERYVGKLEPDQLYKLLSKKEPLLILDVRTPDEFVGERGHIEGATLIPLPELERKIGELQFRRTQTVVTV
jgi:3-mercaptopyruvate sulfurtransferase SseA